MNNTNLAWRRAGLDAELRLVGMERDPGLNGLGLFVAIDRAQERLPEIRRKYGADLLYAVTYDATAGACGVAFLRTPGVTAALARDFTSTGAIQSYCLVSFVLAHEVGHNLGLDHEIEEGPGAPYVPFGHGYTSLREDHVRVQDNCAGELSATGFRYCYHSTIMALWPIAGVGFFSTPDLLHGRVIGNAETSHAARALRYTIPAATHYSPTVVPDAQADPEDYGCVPDDRVACLNNWRFEVSAFAAAPEVRGDRAHVLETFGLGDSASLFYFFDANNPELLVKVVNGCRLNDHWWVFGSAATDLYYEVSIGDMATSVKGDPDEVLFYRHLGGGVIASDHGYSTGAGVINDTRAFPCNP